MSDKNKESPDSENKTLRERTSLLEGATAVIGLILVVLSVGYIAFKGFTERDSPPDLVVSVTSIKTVTSGYLVEFKVKNEGEKTAANVVIEGKLAKNDEDFDTKTTTINYIASKSEQSGGLYYEEDPAQNKLVIKAVGYENP